MVLKMFVSGLYNQSLRRREDLLDFGIETSVIGCEEPPCESSWQTRHLASSENVVRSIYRREIGLQCPKSFQSDIIDSKIKYPKITKAISFIDSFAHESYETIEIVMLKPANRSIIACWKADEKNYFIGILDNDIVDKENGICCMKLCAQGYTITDLCECYPGQTKIIVASNNQHCVGNIALLKVNHLQQLFKYKFDYRSPIWCCSSNYKHPYFSIGLENRVLVYSTSNLVAFNIPVPGKVYSIYHDFSRNVIYSGLNTGLISIDDPRDKKNVSAFRMGRSPVNEVLVSKKGDFVICADMEDNLCRMEARMGWRKLVKYEDYIMTKNKSSIHFSENSKIICSTGNDNVTRLWGLENGGSPKHCIAPDVNFDRQSTATIVESGGRCLIYHVALTKFRIFEL